MAHQDMTDAWAATLPIRLQAVLEPTSAILRSVISRDYEAFIKVTTPDMTFVDRRQIPVLELDRDDALDLAHAVLDEHEDFDFTPRLHAISERGIVVCRTHATLEDLRVNEIDVAVLGVTDSRMSSLEFFSESDLDRAIDLHQSF